MIKKITVYSLMTLLGLFCLFGFFTVYKNTKKRTVNYIVKKIQSELKENKDNIQLEWGELSISFLPVKLKIKDIRARIINNKLFSEPIIVKTLIVEPDYIGLFKKKLSAKVSLIDANVVLQKGHRIVNSGKVKIQEYLQLDSLVKSPVTNLIVKNAQLHFLDNKNQVIVNNLNTNIRLSTSKLTVKADTSSLQVNSRPVFSSVVDMTLKEDFIHLNNFKIKNKTSWLNASGSLKGKIELQKIQSGQINIEGSFLAEDLGTVAKIVDPVFENPVKGKMTLNTGLQYNKTSKLKGFFHLSAEKFSLWDILADQIEVRGNIEKQVVTFKKFNIRSANRWNVEFKESKIKLEEPYSFNTKVLIKDSHLESFFKTFKLKNVPITALTSGKWKCSGTFYLEQNFTCEGVSRLQNFMVHGGREQIVLDIPELEVDSQIAIRNKEFTAQTILKTSDQSQVNIESKLDEKGHFSSQYNGIIPLSDIRNLVNLDPEGILKMADGTLNVIGKKIRIQSNLEIEEFVLSKFRMGKVKAQVNYTEKGSLRFRKINGSIKESQYKGNVNIDIFNNTIQVFAHSPYITLNNLKYILEDRVSFPFQINGAGTFNAYLNSPLKINELSYNLQAQFFKIKWERELFKKAIIQLESKSGYVRTKKVELLKDEGKVLFAGQVDPKGNMKAKMTGLGLLLQDSENISRFTGHEIAGVMNFDMNLDGYFLDPLSMTTISIKDSFYKGYPVGESKINLRLRKNQIELNGSIANKWNIKKLVYPYKDGDLVEIEATTNNLNVKEFFLSKESSTQLYNQFRSKINSHIKLSYKKNHFLKSVTGTVSIDNFQLEANSYELMSKWPFTLELKEGALQVSNILLESEGDSLHIIQNEKGKIVLSGNTKLDFFVFLFPFMRMWEGHMTANLDINPQLFDLSFQGQMGVKNGFIQLNNNIDPFEEIYADIKVENRTMIFQSLYAKIGGGSLKGKGSVSFPMDGSIPVSLTGAFTQVQFSSLPGIYTRGSGRLFLTGKNIPYILGITADIEDTRIEKEFISSESNKVKVNPRLFFLKEDKESFTPIRMQFNLYCKEPVEIENSTMKSSFKGRIKIIGDPLNPLLSGKLAALPGGTIIFRDHEFDILSSQITYFNDKPSNPVIDLRAKTIVREDRDISESSIADSANERSNVVSGFSNEYNILLRVKGKGEAPVFTLTSTPAVTESEIVSLLAFGVRSVNFEQGNMINNIAKYSYYQLGPVLFQKAIGRELKDTLGVDQFLIVPHISSKTNSTSTKVILRKKMFNRLNLSASKTVLDDYPEDDIKAEYKINNNISIVGAWKYEEPIEGSDADPNTIGLDLEYQLDF